MPLKDTTGLSDNYWEYVLNRAQQAGDSYRAGLARRSLGNSMACGPHQWRGGASDAKRRGDDDAELLFSKAIELYLRDGQFTHAEIAAKKAGDTERATDLGKIVNKIILRDAHMASNPRLYN